MKLISNKKIVVFLALASLLLCQMFPIHLHIHNHTHAGTEQFGENEIHFINFEKDPAEAHKHALVFEFASDFLKNKNKNSITDNIALLLFLMILLILFSYIRNPMFIAPVYWLIPVFLRPLLRAPPVRE